MFYLLASILLNALIFIFFKFYPRYKIDTLQAIVVNYLVCAITGSLFLGNVPALQAGISSVWLPWAILMGVLFISLFNLIGYCIIKDGITTTTVANKLSLVIPVTFSILLYGEHIDTFKILGILIALPAVYLTTRVPEEKKTTQNFWLPALLFIGSGTLDTLVKYTEHHFLHDTESTVVYTVYMFAAAAITGSLLITVLALTGKIKLKARNIIAGIILGVPNYFSIYYLVKLLNSNYFQSSAAIPVNNIGIVLACALTGIFLFREKTSASRIIGLILAVMAIVLIAYADWNGRSA